MFKKIFAVVSILTSHTFAQNLEAILSNTRLPVRVEGMPVVFDGEDSVYVLGGDGINGIQRDILKFSVTTQTLEKVGTMDPVTHGTAVWACNENILYFGGYIGSQYQAKIWSYKPNGANDWTQIGDLPRSKGFTSSVWGQGEYSYVFGGYDGTHLNTISRYSSATNATIEVKELPGPRYGTSAVWDEATGNAYVFGGAGLNDILKFNPTMETVVKLNVTLPKATSYSCAIWTGTEAYIIGGLSTIGQTFARFNPSTNEVLDIAVRNLPANLYRHGCTFVKKLNRIYLFGGSVLVLGRRDQIMYIDLGPSTTTPTTTTAPTTTTTAPTTTTTTAPTTMTTTALTTTTNSPGNPTDCNNEADGTRFPNQYCCESYYQCQNQEAVRRQCPSQLHYNPSHEECDVPEIVKCRSTYE